MKIRNTFTKHITITIAVAAMLVVVSTWPTQAQHVRAFRGTAVAGFIPGQTLRFSVANLSTPEEGGKPIRAQVKLYDAQGATLAESEEVEALPGQFRSFDFNREDLRVAGEPGAGRLQVRADIRIISLDGGLTGPNTFLASMEGVDNRTGGNYSTGYVKIADD